MAKQPLLLMILDGWGIAPAGQYNAAALAKTPNLDALFDKYPHTRLSCSGCSPMGVSNISTHLYSQSYKYSL